MDATPSTETTTAQRYSRHRAALEAIAESGPMLAWLPIVCDVPCLTPEDIPAPPRTRAARALAGHADLAAQGCARPTASVTAIHGLVGT